MNLSEEERRKVFVATALLTGEYPVGMLIRVTRSSLNGWEKTVNGKYGEIVGTRAKEDLYGNAKERRKTVGVHFFPYQGLREYRQSGNLADAQERKNGTSAPFWLDPNSFVLVSEAEVTSMVREWKKKRDIRVKKR